MLRGYLTSTVARSVNHDRMDGIRLRATRESTRGFLSNSSDVLDMPGKTVAGSGEIKYKLHSRSYRRPEYARRDLRLLRRKVEAFVVQTEVEDFVPPRRVLSLTGRISFNGKAWSEGSGCLFYLDDDARSQRKPRVGKVVRFLALEVDDVEEFFVEITEHKILRWQRTIAIVDLTKRTTTQLTHASHIVALAAYAPYWEPQFVQYKCVTTAADTY